MSDSPQINIMEKLPLEIVSQIVINMIQSSNDPISQVRNLPQNGEVRESTWIFFTLPLIPRDFADDLYATFSDSLIEEFADIIGREGHRELTWEVCHSPVFYSFRNPMLI